MSRGQFAILIVVLIAMAIYLKPADQVAPLDYGGCIDTGAANGGFYHPSPECLPIYHGK